ncbi:PadR family transcriptional regulator [uncultured Microbacterium sp.]|uniref:PadR family transcriptional regulator n=1 Tax=uncultured Microbacterium sp. TaxID=191216 RepID=UPI0025ECFD93|nr:PadR family transcriptional regulator [uncultured Microbacterium sp.]
MSGSFLGDAFGGRGGNNTPGWPMSNILEGLEQLRTQFEQKSGSTPRMNKGDVRSAVLSLLLEQPMHGYQIIREIEDRSGGSWKPSPGSVYPTLQLLTDEGLVQAEESNGRKTYSLTAEGRAAAGDETTERTAPWEAAGSRDGGRMTALPKAGIELAQAAAQVGRTGDKEQVAQAVEILDEARRKLYSILAQG